MKRVRAALGNRGDIADAAELSAIVHFADSDFGYGVERREQLR